MENSQVKLFFKSIMWGIVWAGLLVLIGLVVTNITKYNFKDVIFSEGMIVVLLGVFSSIGGNPLGLSFQAMGQNNSQYVSKANLEISKMEKDKIGDSNKTNIKFGFSTISLIIGGVICIIINFII